MDKVRIDKWLWAARFFKTRGLAKAAIEGGKVRVNGERPKPSKEITAGMVLTIRQGWDEKTVTILKLSEQRRGAPEAAQLYQESQESITNREQKAAERKLLKAASGDQHTRPTKKQRRMIHRFKDEFFDQ